MSSYLAATSVKSPFGPVSLLPPLLPWQLSLLHPSSFRLTSPPSLRYSSISSLQRQVVSQSLRNPLRRNGVKPKSGKITRARCLCSLRFLEARSNVSSLGLSCMNVCPPTSFCDTSNFYPPINYIIRSINDIERVTPFPYNISLGITA
jgi:hypothetical protein